MPEPQAAAGRGRTPGRHLAPQQCPAAAAHAAQRRLSIRCRQDAERLAPSTQHSLSHPSRAQPSASPATKQRRRAAAACNQRRQQGTGRRRARGCLHADTRAAGHGKAWQSSSEVSRRQQPPHQVPCKVEAWRAGGGRGGQQGAHSSKARVDRDVRLLGSSLKPRQQGFQLGSRWAAASTADTAAGSAGVIVAAVAVAGGCLGWRC